MWQIDKIRTTVTKITFVFRVCIFHVHRPGTSLDKPLEILGFLILYFCFIICPNNASKMF